jgi:hypothetical protein
VHKLLIVMMLGLVALTTFEVPTTAHPCRPDAPDCRRPHPPPPPPPPPAVITTIYQRAIAAAPPASLDRASLSGLLAGSAWTRLGSREQIRFVEPAREGHFARPPTPSRDRAVRAVTIELVRDRRAFLVNIDGSLYTVTACQMPRYDGARPGMVTTACLEHRDAGGAFGGQGYGGVTYGGR